MKEKEPHAGKMIKAELKRQGRTITWLAQQFGYTRENMYKTLSRSWLRTEHLLKISVIMDCDFFQYYSDWYKKNKGVNSI